MTYQGGAAPCRPRWTGNLMAAALAVAVCAWSVLAGALPSWAGTGPLANPAANRQPPYYSENTGNCSFGPKGWSCPSPCFPKEVIAYSDAPKCVALILSAVNQAQQHEGRRALVLPSNYFTLSASKQVFVLVNLERLSRGVPPLVGLSPYLGAVAESAALKAEDPPFQTSYGPVKVWFPPDGGNYGFGSTWSGDTVNAMEAMFGWMYDDGWGGSRKNTSNFACTSATSAGCWGHRDILLGEFTGITCTTCIAGSAFAGPLKSGWSESYTFLEVRPVSPTPLDFTWDGEIKYLPPGWERTAAP